MTQLTREQKMDIIDKSLDADERGDHEEANRLMLQLPVPPYLAQIFKEVWGKDFLLEGGYDLSLAEAEYGKNWLDA